MSKLWPKKNLKIFFFRKYAIFCVFFFGITRTFFNNFQNGFLFDHQWLKAFLLMYNPTIFKKIYFSILICDPLKLQGALI